MKDTMNIILAGRSDLEELASLFNQYQIFYGKEHDLTCSKQFIESRFQQKDSLLYLCKNEGEVLGFSQIYFSFSSVQMRSIWILNDLFVVAKARRKGVAESLINKILSDVKVQGVARVTLHTQVSNHAAQSLYKKLNFKLDEEFFSFNYVG